MPKKVAVAGAARRQRGRVWAPTAVNVGVAALSLPLVFLFNVAMARFRPEVAGAIAAFNIIAVALLVKRLAPKQPAIFYGFSVFVFMNTVVLLIPLEIDGVVTGFVDMYLMKGEPYLFSAWGAVVAYWDGTVNLVIYILMGYCVSNGLSYRTLALFYSSNVLNIMLVLVLAVFMSLTGLQWCTLFNIPYVVFPAFLLWSALAAPATRQIAWPQRSLRVAVALLLMAAAVFCFIRGMALFGSRVALMKYYRSSVEPLMNQTVPAPFAGMQLAVFLFYFAPAYVVMAVALLGASARGWVRDLAVVMTGAAVQAEVTLVGMAWHSLTQPEHRLAADAGGWALALHWAAHGLVLAAPAAAAIALSCAPDTSAKAKKA